MEQYSNSATRQLAGAGSGAARWVASCVAALADDLAGAGADPATHRGLISIAGNGAEFLTRGSGGELQSAGHASADDVATAARRLLPRRARQDAVLRIAGDRAIQKRVTLPAAALEVLPAVIRNKVESLAPWPLSEVMWGYQQAAADGNGQIDVDVAIVSRRTVDGLLSALAQGGVNVRALQLGEGDSAIFVDIHGPGRSARMRSLLNSAIVLAGLTATGVAGYGGYLAYVAQDELWAIEQRSEEVRQALLGRRDNTSGEAALRSANDIHSRKSATLPVVAVLNALTRHVPDGTWLTDVDYDSGKVAIAGQGRDVSKVIESLDSSPEFDNVNFAAATQRDGELGTDSFAISAAVAAAQVKP